MLLHRGDRVTTPLGPGGVAYCRMAPPTYATPESVSVVLDAKREFAHYAGTIFPIELVALVTKEGPIS